MMGWNFLKMRCSHPSSCQHHCTLSIAISASISSFYSTHFRVVIFHYFIMCTLIPLSCSLYSNSKIHYPSHVLKIPSSLLHEMTSFLNFVQFLNTMQLPLGKKKMKWNERSIFIDFLANFHCQFHSSGFFGWLRSSVYCFYCILTTSISIFIAITLVMCFSPTAMSYDSWMVLRRIKNY